MILDTAHEQFYLAGVHLTEIFEAGTVESDRWIQATDLQQMFTQLDHCADQMSWQTEKCWKCGIDLGDLSHLALHQKQKLKEGNNIRAIMMARDLILTPWVPRGVLLLVFFLKKQMGTEDCNHPN